MRYFPLGFDLSKGTCLLVGEGQIALNKARLLIKAQANLVLAADSPEQSLLTVVEDAQGVYLQRNYRAGDCEGKILVVVATEDKALAADISAAAQRQYTPVNVVDNPTLSTVIFPSLVERPPLWFAISSEGTAPLLVHYWRHRLEESIESSWGDFALLWKEFRGSLNKKFTTVAQRLDFLRRIVASPVLSLLNKADKKSASALFKDMLMSKSVNKKPGEVWLVGAGPGDADLLTIAAARLLQRADVVLHDRLVSAAVLDRVRREARLINVGKACADHPVPQEEINRLLVAEAKKGACVLRLKGGDPFIFGRGGEELEYLAQHNIPFGVVPGVTAANGCSCYAGIPLTDRRYASSVHFLSGHTRNNRLDLPWDKLTTKDQTLVFYMSKQRLALLIESLLSHGVANDTPAAIIEKGCMPQQRVIVGLLSNIVAKALAADLEAPTLLIIGTVVSMYKQLAWYGKHDSAIN